MAKTNKLPAGWTLSTWNTMYWKGARGVMRSAAGWVVYLDRYARFPFSPSNRLPETFATPEAAMKAADVLA